MKRITRREFTTLAAVEEVLGCEQPDFLQVDYSLDNREAEKRRLPLAAEVRAGVLTAVPFGRGRLFRAVRGEALPEWATEFAGTWAQFFLMYRWQTSGSRRSSPAPPIWRIWGIISAPCAVACPIRTSAGRWWPSSTVSSALPSS